MKRIYTFFALMVASVAASAQLAVDSNGNIALKGNHNSSYSVTLDASNRQPFYVKSKNFTGGTWSNAITSFSEPYDNRFGVGVHGMVYNYAQNGQSGRAFGVLGRAGYATNGYNYGVYGTLYNRETQKLDIFLGEETRGSRVCIMSLDDDGENYYVTDERTGNPLFPYSIPPINCSVCISKPGYIPFVFYLYNSEIIQNEIIEGPAFCISNGIQIGKDVTDTKPHGPVSLERGNMMVYSPNGVSINNSFEAKIGCTLNIEPTSENILTLISIGNQE
jgi:hypothetical protein